MSKIVNLPSGATVTLRDPRELKQKDRAKLYIKSGEDAIAGGLAVVNNLMAILIEEWSFDLIPPSVKIESLGELSIADYDALQEEAEKAMPVLFPNLAKSDDADPKAPIAN
jgi:hypothetical protein